MPAQAAAAPAVAPLPAVAHEPAPAARTEPSQLAPVSAPEPALERPAQPAAVRRAEEGRPIRKHAVQFAAPEIDPGDNRLFGFEGTEDGEPSGQYIENLTSLVPQAAPAAVVTTAVHQGAPFAMQRQQVGGPSSRLLAIRSSRVNRSSSSARVSRTSWESMRTSICRLSCVADDRCSAG